MTNTTKIADEFGKKIGGSKRDLWKARGLMVEDLTDMNDAEMAKYVKKDNIWGKPDYQALKDEGLPVTVIYFRKLLRDSLAAKLTGNAEDYISVITNIRDEAEAIRSNAGVEAFFNRVIVGNGYAYKNGGWSYHLSDAFRNAGGSKTFKVAANVQISSLERDIRKKQFLYDEDDKILANYGFYPKNIFTVSDEYKVEGGVWLKTSYMGFAVYGLTKEAFESLPDDAYIAVSGGHRYIGTAESEAVLKDRILQASKALKAAMPEEEKEEKGRKTRFVPKQLEGIVRTGGEDVRNGRDITGEDYLSRFHFYGGEMGNWMNQNDRQASLNMGYEAFHDLAKALNIPEGKIAVDESLSIAFGARGSGNALAHYEPLRQVINLTKMNGAGSLAHEYGHALDDILSKKAGNKSFFTENLRNAPQSVKDLVSLMKYKNVTKEVVFSDEDRKKAMEKAMKNLSYYLDNEFYRVDDAGKKELEAFKEELLNLKPGDMDAFGRKYHAEMESEYKSYAIAHACTEYLSDLKKRSVKRAQKLKKDSENAVRYYISDIFSALTKPEKEMKEMRDMTDFYRSSKMFDAMNAKEDKGYWASDVEMLARAFACYVKDKLKEQGIRNDYLCGHADSAVSMNMDGEIVRAYPYGEERVMINAAMDKVMDDFRGIILKETAA